MSVYIGIDPGLKGCIAVITPYGHLPDLYDTPTTEYIKRLTKKKTRKMNNYDLDSMVLTARSIRRVWDAHERYWFLEDVHSVPGFRSRPEVSLDRAVGLWEGIIEGLREELVLVKPKDWEKEFGLIGEDKDAAIEKALELFPGINLKRPRARTNSSDRADALLIAAYGRRVTNNE